MQPELPTGTVTFLFTDGEGSTKLLNELGAEDYSRALAEHRRILREAFKDNEGVEVDTQGDASSSLSRPRPARWRPPPRHWTDWPLDRSACARASTREPHRGARRATSGSMCTGRRVIAACGHGGQVLVSASTAALAGTNGLRDLGEHRLKDLTAPERIYQLGDGNFPPLKILHRTNLPIPATPFLGREEELAPGLPSMISHFTGVHAGPRFKSKFGNCLDDRRRAAQSARRSVEAREKAVTCRVDLASAKLQG